MHKVLLTLVFLLLVFLVAITSAMAQVGIGTTSPDNSAQLDISSNSKGLLIPRMTSIQRTSISSPARGLMVFDNDSSYFFYYNGTSWIGIQASSSVAAQFWQRPGNYTILSNYTDNVGIGNLYPNYKLDVTGPVNADSFMSTGYNVLNTKNYNTLVGRNAGALVTNNATQNTYTGYQAGYNSDSAYGNVFNGFQAGYSNTSGSTNEFIGLGSGYKNRYGSDNIFVGQSSGFNNINGSENNFFGTLSGYDNTSGSQNIFIGTFAGRDNTTGNYNYFTGYYAGYFNTTGNNNYASGTYSGLDNQTGDSNTSVGVQAGEHMQGGSNTFLGFGADASYLVNGPLTNATAIGANAQVGQSNSIVLGATSSSGSQPNVGIGTTTPDYSAVLDLESSSQGMLIPRMTSNLRTSISSPATGLLVFDMDSGYVFYYNSGWIGIKGGPSAPNFWSQSGTQTTLTNISNNVGIGTASPDNSAQLDITSNSKGLLIPRMTSSQRTSISSPATGLLVFDNDSVFFMYYDGSTWQPLKAPVSSVAGDWFRNGPTTQLANKYDSVGIGKYPDFKLDVRGPVNADSFMSGGQNALSTKFGNTLLGVSAGKNTTGYQDNTMLGVNAGYNTDTGYENVFVGADAGLYNTSGNNNVFVGSETGGNNSSGSFNTFTGYAAGGGNNGSNNEFYGYGAGAFNKGSDNDFFGQRAGYLNTTGSNNIFMGFMSGDNNTTGSNNIIIGPYAGYSNNGSNNQFIGNNAGGSNTSGNYNQFTGYNSGGENTTGDSNQFDGVNAGQRNSTGSNNYFSGLNAGAVNRTGNYNYASGNSAGFENYSGDSNTSVGSYAGYSASGTGNTFIGAGTDDYGGTLTNATAIGYNAKVTQSNSIVLGTTSNYGIQPNVGIGTTSPDPSAMLEMKSYSQGILIPRMASSQRTAISSPATGLMVFDVDSGYFFFFNSGWKGIRSSAAIPNYWNRSGSNTTLANTGDNVGIGKSPSYKLDVQGGIHADSLIVDNSAHIVFQDTSNYNNLFIGQGTGDNNTGTYNLFIGNQAGVSNTYGGGNYFIGFDAGTNNTTGEYNYITGALAGVYNSTGNQNYFSGFSSGYWNTDGSNNTAVGTQAGKNYNGNKNTYLGSGADASTGGLSNATAIGYGATVGQSNSLVLGNGVNVGVGTSTPDNSAVLDLTSTSRGMLMPRMSTSQRTSISSPATGLEVFDTDSSYFFYYNGIAWTGIQSNSTVPAQYWKRNNSELTLAHPTDSVGIGKTPAYSLDVKGPVNTDSIMIGGITEFRTQSNYLPIYQNLFIGMSAGENASNAFDNIFTGYQAGYSGSGWYNVESGFQAGMNSSGTANIILGEDAGTNNSGNYNVIAGTSAGLYTTGNNNIITGYFAGQINITGFNNVFEGAFAGEYNYTGFDNVAIGNYAATNSAGNYNTFIGDSADATSGNLHNATAIGYDAKVGQNNSLVLGNDSVNVGVGTSTPNNSAVLDLTSTTRGMLIPRMNTTQRFAISSPATGLQVYDNTINKLYFYNGTAWDQAADSASAAYSAGYGITISGNTISTEIQQNEDVAGNINIGNHAAGNLQTGSAGNVFLGEYSGNNDNYGSDNSFLGNETGIYNTYGNFNAFYGALSGYNNTTGNNNTAMGNYAGQANTTGSFNTFIGDSTGAISGGLTYATAIGHGAMIGQSNSIVLGNGSVNVGIGTSTPNTSAVLDLTSTTQGMLMPRMSSSKRTAISLPAKGLTVFDNDSSYFFYYNGSAWKSLKNVNFPIYTAGTGLSLSGIAFSAKNTTALWNANQVEGKNISPTAPSNNQVLKYNSGLSEWTPATDTGSQWTTSGSNIYYNTGNVAIGSTTATFPLDIKKGQKDLLRLTNTTGGSGSDAYMSFLTYNPTTKANAVSARIGGQDNGAFGGSLVFEVGDSGASSTTTTEAMRVASNGSVGIGSNNPLDKLQIDPKGSGGISIGTNGGTGGYTYLSMDISAQSNGYSSLQCIKSAGGSYGVIDLNPAAGNVGIGTTNPYHNLDVKNGINTDSAYMLNEQTFISNKGTGNIFMGYGAGKNNTPGGIFNGMGDQFLGDSAGYSNTSGGLNCFTGYYSGYANTTGGLNVFVGTATGSKNTSGSDNAFMGYNAGGSNTTGSENTFLGIGSGSSNIGGSFNSFSGNAAGGSTTTGGHNTAFGNLAGYNNTTGYNNTLIGDSADVTTGNLTNATAIGFNARVSQSNSMVLGNGAAVGIGTSAPSYPLDISKGQTDLMRVTSSTGGSGNHAYIDFLTYAPSTVPGAVSARIGALDMGSNDGSLVFEVGNAGAQSTTTTEAMRIINTGNVCIGTTTANGKLTVAGNVAPSADNSYTCGTSGDRWSTVYATNGTIQTSDRRLKDSIKNLNYGLNEVLAMRPVSYYWKKNPEQGKKVGLIAQEVQQIVPEVVKVGDDSMKTLGMNYAELVPVLVKAIQEQQKIIESQKSALNEQKASIENQNARLDALESALANLKPATTASIK